MMDLIISTATQGFIYALLSYGIYITYKILDGEALVAETTSADTKVNLTIENVHLWNGRKDPHLYNLVATLSKDGEEGYPGNLSITITYSLNNEGALSIRYEATTDKKTIINLTNHLHNTHLSFCHILHVCNIISKL